MKKINALGKRWRIFYESIVTLIESDAPVECCREFYVRYVCFFRSSAVDDNLSKSWCGISLNVKYTSSSDFSYEQTGRVNTVVLLFFRWYKHFSASEVAWLIAVALIPYNCYTIPELSWPLNLFGGQAWNLLLIQCSTRLLAYSIEKICPSVSLCKWS